MTPSLVSFRCDGDDRIGAGHVARCVQLAKAFAAGGTEVVFEGSFGGTAAQLLEAAGFPARPALGAEAGELSGAGVIVDSYSIGDAELEQMARDRPTAVICDAGRAPRVTAVLSPHLGAVATDAATVPIVGADYAPVSPELLGARRERGFARVLVSMGGGGVKTDAIVAAVQALRELGGLRIFVAAAGPLPATLAGADLKSGAVRGLGERIAWADVAVAGGGTTAYDLACAGVPAVLAVLADNQRPIVRTLSRAGVALPSCGEPAATAFAAAVRRLAEPESRAALASAGPRLVDGYGAFRARDALTAAFSGRAAPPILRYRPATMADAERLLSWRNEPTVRKWSHSTGPIGREDHLRWLQRRFAERRQWTLLAVPRGADPVGMVRFDRTGDGAQISVTVDRAARGAGVGTRMIRQASELLLAAFPEIGRVTADVHASNDRSLAAFTRAGFGEPVAHGEAPEWRLFVLDRAMLRATTRRWLQSGP